MKIVVTEVMRVKVRWFMAAALAGAALITVVVKPPGVGLDKVAGVLLAAAAVLPVFLLLKRAMASGSTNRVLGVFVGGFLFKLVFILAGVWFAVSRAGLDMVGFTVSCLAFLFVLQVCEALYFWGVKGDADHEG